MQPDCASNPVKGELDYWSRPTVGEFHHGINHIFMYKLEILYLIVLCNIIQLTHALPRPDGELTPVMGWNSWNKFACQINETLIQETADALVERGFAAAGYRFVNVDDCWQRSRDKDGNIEVDASTFPSGMKNLGDYIHSKGLKYGIYSSAGTKTCQGRPGSLGHETQDAKFYAHVGADLLKYDNCYNEGLPYWERFKAMGDALQEATEGGSPIIYSICEWGYSKPWVWAPKVGHYWRTTLDICNKFSEDGQDRSFGNTIVHSFFSILDMVGLRTIVMDNAAIYLPGWLVQWVPSNAPCSVLSILDQSASIQHISSVQVGFNDPDMLEVGNNGMTFEEEKTHFILWAALKSPLIIGCDVRTVDDKIVSLLTHDEIIAINQDALGKSIVRIWQRGGLELWAGPLKDGHVAVLLNRGNQQDFKLTFSDIPGLPSNRNHLLRDVYDRINAGVFAKSHTFKQIPHHGAKLVKITDAGDIKLTVQE